MVAVGLKSGVVLLLQAASLSEKRAIDVAKEEGGSLKRGVAVVALRFDHSGQRLAVAFADGRGAVLAVGGGWIVALPVGSTEESQAERQILGLDWSKDGRILRAYGGASSVPIQTHSPTKLKAAHTQLRAAVSARKGDWVKVWSLNAPGRNAKPTGRRSREKEGGLDEQPEAVLVLRVKDGGSEGEKVWWEAQYVGALVGVTWGHTGALAVPRVLEGLQGWLPGAPLALCAVTSDAAGHVLCVGGDNGSVWTVARPGPGGGPGAEAAPAVNLSSLPAHSTPVGQVEVGNTGHAYSIGKQEGHLVEWRAVVHTGKGKKKK